jgi:hypothetical protein
MSNLGYASTMTDLAHHSPHRSSDHSHLAVTKQSELLRFDRVLDVSSVLELGYSVHVSNDPKTNRTKAGIAARQLLDELLSWKAPTGSPDHVYLFKVREVVIKLGNGITRRKQTYREEVDAANHKRVEELKALNIARNDDFWFALWVRSATAAGIMAIAAAIGFALAESVLPFVPLHTEHAVEQAGYWPSILLAGVFAAISRNIAKWLSQLKFEHVFRDYEIARQQAWMRYQKGKLNEYELAEKDIRRFFHEYTGRKAPQCVSYAAILNEEISTDKSLNRERAKLSENVLVRTLAKLRHRFRKRRIKKVSAVKIMKSAAATHGLPEAQQ